MVISSSSGFLFAGRSFCCLSSYKRVIGFRSVFAEEEEDSGEAQDQGELTVSECWLVKSKLAGRLKMGKIHGEKQEET